MSILTSASSSSVRRGYDYYKLNKVKNINQLNNHEFEKILIDLKKSDYQKCSALFDEINNAIYK